MIPNLASPRRAFPRTGMALALLLSLAGGGALAADMQRGSALYATHCAGCHGADGKPTMAGAPNFRRMERLMKPDMQLMTTIRSGKGACPSFFGVLREREILDVIAFLRTLS